MPETGLAADITLKVWTSRSLTGLYLLSIMFCADRMIG
jgi:hypothetical protein